MINEKMMILKMLEEKKITAEEASKLLESASKGEAVKNEHQYKEQPKTNTSSERTYSRSTSSEKNTYQNNQNNNSQQTATQSFDDFANDIAKKFDDLARDFEPKLQKFTQIVVEKTAVAADKISKSLQNFQYSEPERKSPPRPESSYHSPKRTSQQEKSFELVVDTYDNQLNLTALNGDVLIRGYNGDKITAKVFYKSKRGSTDIELIKLSNKYLINYNEDDFDFVSIDVFLPEKLFSNLIIESNNGQINISTVTCKYCVVNNLNGVTTLSDIYAENLKIECNNNSLKLNNVSGNISKIENYNGNISISNLDIEKLKIDSFNSDIVAHIESYNRFNEYLWEIEASNGKISLNVPSARDLGYYINARTSLSNVKVGLVGLNYLANSSNFIEARSIEYDSVPKHVLLRLETSNAPLIIN